MGGGPEWIHPSRPLGGFPGMPGQGDKKYLRAIVDMGSNGIRLSVSDLSPPLSRTLPTVYVIRNDISLYAEQFDPDTGEKVPIPRGVIDAVIAQLVRFKIVCKDLGVHDNHIRIIATEATRTAINSEEYRKSIENATGIKVEMLAKEDEGRIGALGIASGFSDVRGLVMDLGGGSMQVPWMIMRHGKVTTSPKGAFSFPYGAAAMTKRLEDIEKGKDKHDAELARELFRREMASNFRDAYNKLEIPDEMVERAKHEGGFQLYLSGGGFRGWGYLLLYLNQKNGRHYPISLINGFTAQRSQFADTKRLKEVARTSHQIFRVSDRRRGQVPAVAFLVHVLQAALPHGIKEAHFCQGGVREGVLYQELSQSVRMQDPLEVATSLFARPSANDIAKLLLLAIPPSASTTASWKRRFPQRINVHVIHALANAMYVHQIMSKESASTAALYSTSTGLLSSVHGVSHIDRALLALLLEARYEGELPPRETTFKADLMALLTFEEAWWVGYLGKVAFIVSRLYPSGFVDVKEPRVALKAEWADDLGKDGKDNGLKLVMSIQKRENDPMELAQALRDHKGVIEKVGRRKHWIGGRKGWGMKVKVDIVEVDIQEVSALESDVISSTAAM